LQNHSSAQGKLTPRRQDAKMNEDETGKAAVDAALTLRGLKLGFLLSFGSNLMRNEIERVVNGVEDEQLGVLASWREMKTQANTPNRRAGLRSRLVIRTSVAGRHR
jgi:hypothetical protein